MADRVYCDGCDANPVRVTHVATVEGGHVDVVLCSACLVKVVLTDPDALWAVLTSEVNVAGPWERRGGVSRRDLPGGAEGRWNTPAVVEDIERCKSRHENPYDSAYCPECGKRTNVTMFLANTACSAQDEILATRAEAEAWCDAKLREAGWLLVEEEAQGG